MLRHAACQARLSLAIAEAIQLKSQALILLDKNGKPALHTIVMPLPAAALLNTAWQRPLAMLVLTELKTSNQLPHDFLRQLFGFTPAEARLANGLMTGATLEEYAHKNALSVLTARTQLRALLAKTGTRRQSELVLLLGRVPVLQGAGF